MFCFRHCFIVWFYREEFSEALLGCDGRQEQLLSLNGDHGNDDIDDNAGDDEEEEEDDEDDDVDEDDFPENQDAGSDEPHSLQVKIRAERNCVWIKYFMFIMYKLSVYHRHSEFTWIIPFIFTFTCRYSSRIVVYDLFVHKIYYDVVSSVDLKVCWANTNCCLFPCLKFL